GVGVCASAGRPSGQPGERRVRSAGGGAGVPVLPLVCLCLGLLWLRSPPVAACTPGLAVLSALARATCWGWFADLAGVWAWLPITCLPSRATRARGGVGPGSLPGPPSGRRELTPPAHRPPRRCGGAGSALPPPLG